MQENRGWRRAKWKRDKPTPLSLTDISPEGSTLQHRSATMLRLYSTQQPLACPTLSATMPPGSPGKPVGQDWPSLATFKAWEANGSRSNGQTPRSPPARQHTSKEAAFRGEVERLGSVDLNLLPRLGE